MATVTYPVYCNNCQHKAVCSILKNIKTMDDAIATFNSEHLSSLQKVSSINYSCSYKLKEV